MPKEKDLKEVILDYIQNNDISIRTKWGVLNTRFEDNPPRLVLTTSSLTKPPEIMYEGLNIPVELEDPNTPNMQITKADPNEKFHKELSTEAQKALGISETISPQLINEDNVKDLDAFRKWKERYKVGGEEK